jgi:hypothetical protein
VYRLVFIQKVLEWRLIMFNRIYQRSIVLLFAAVLIFSMTFTCWAAEEDRFGLFSVESLAIFLNGKITMVRGILTKLFLVKVMAKASDRTH